MKTTIILAIVLGLSSLAAADQWDAWGGKKSDPNYEKDSYGHYTKRENLYKDSDRDGVVNRYDYSDRNSSVQTPRQQDYYGTNSNYGRRHDVSPRKSKGGYGY